MKKLSGKNSNETRVVCPNCGTEIAIAEKEHVAMGLVVGKDSNLGTIVLPAANQKNKALERIAALKEAGIDTSSLFAVKSASGEDLIAKNVDGVITLLSDDNEIFQNLKQQGDIPNRALFRRWVMAQMFRLLSWESDGYTITDFIHWRGYEYMWKMLIDEYKAQAKMFKNKDLTSLRWRKLFFNKETAIAIAENFISQVEKIASKAPRRKCKGVPYITIGGKHVFVVDFESKILAPLRTALYSIKGASTEETLYNAIFSFHIVRCRLHLKMRDLKQPTVWLNAYKGAGAYYTIQNLIRFHNCYIINNQGKRLDKRQSLVALNRKAEEYSGEGWRLLGFLRKMLVDNDVDINKKMKEWRK